MTGHVLLDGWFRYKEPKSKNAVFYWATVRINDIFENLVSLNKSKPMWITLQNTNRNCYIHPSLPLLHATIQILMLHTYTIIRCASQLTLLRFYVNHHVRGTRFLFR